MPDLVKLQQSKEKILLTIQLKGPSLPIQIAKVLNTELLFASAILSELKAEQKLKTSSMKIGSSPLYYISGQEEKLESFIQHLNSREKEAFNLLKQSKILEDEKQTPVVRVALRSLKDFAIPIKAKLKDESKVIWKYFTLSNEGLRQEIQNLISQKPAQETPEIKEKPKPPETIKPAVQTQAKITSPPKQKQKVKQKQQEENKFSKKIHSHLSSKDIELLETLSDKKREFIGKVRINDLFGKQEFYLTAKDKKKITEDDLSLALQKSQSEKMPALILSSGELDKKAQEHLKEYRNLIKFQKLKI